MHRRLFVLGRHHPEDSLQITIKQWLDWALIPPAWYTHFPAGGGGEDRGKRLKRIGLKPGVPDLYIATPDQTCWLELKAGRTPTSDNQREVHAILQALGHRVAVVRSFGEAEAILWEWGVPLRTKKPIASVLRGLAAELGKPLA